MRRYYISLAIAGGLMVFSTAAVAATTRGGVGLSPPRERVSSRPVRDTPHLGPSKNGRVEQIRQIVRCGSRMYAVGSFSVIDHGGHVYQRRNVFSFGATAPYRVSSWAPRVNGMVNSITFSRKCAHAYIGGSFSSVNGARARNIAAISTKTGRVVKTFAHHASAEVETLLRVRHHLLVGGFYKGINGSSANPYMTSLNPSTGRDDGYLHLRISGHYHFAGAVGNRTRVYNQQLSHSRALDLVEGDFTSVGGRARRQIFMLSLGRRSATVTAWRSPEFSGHCSVHFPFYIHAASWSPNDARIYIATTGTHPYRWHGSFPLTGLCDAAAAFPAKRTSVRHKWINYTGCDSLFSTAADASLVYFGGHERWSENANGCNFQGRGAYNAPGMEGLWPRGGALYLNAKRKAGYYRRSRGYGADDMLRTRAGLWIASDNFDGSDMCGGVRGLAGICFLPNAHTR